MSSETSRLHSVTRWLWIAGLVLAARFSGDFAASEAAKVRAALGGNADYNLIVHEDAFLLMMLALTVAGQSVCGLWIALAGPLTLRWRLAFLGASIFASLPELHYPVAVSLLDAGLLSPDLPWWRINMAAELMVAPGRLVAYLLFGVSFCRWCDGLVDAPTVCGLYDVTAIHLSNSVAYVLATALAWKLADWRSGRRG